MQHNLKGLLVISFCTANNYPLKLFVDALKQSINPSHIAELRHKVISVECVHWRRPSPGHSWKAEDEDPMWIFLQKIGFPAWENSRKTKKVPEYCCMDSQHGSQNISGALFKSECFLCYFAAAPAAFGMMWAATQQDSGFLQQHAGSTASLLAEHLWLSDSLFEQDDESVAWKESSISMVM